MKSAALLSPNQRKKYLAGLRGDAREARAAEIVYRREHRSNEPFVTDEGQPTQRSSHAADFERQYGRQAHDVADAAKLTGIPARILQAVYARGLAAWQTGHRPGASQHAWGLARVYSFATGGPTAHGPDRDLAEKAGLMKNPTEQIDTPEFKRWFGDSKVVDAKGKPLVVYHGTETGGFTTFFESQFGIFFTSNRAVADSYGHGLMFPDPKVSPHDYKPGIYPVFLRILNPLVIEGHGAHWTKVPLEGTGLVGPYGQMEVPTDWIANAAVKKGYDGLILRDIIDVSDFGGPHEKVPADLYVVFEPTQIKSATRNRGTFDPHDPDIRNPTDTFIPPEAVAKEARQALELRAAQPASNRCCTPVGIRRAAQLANRQPVSVDTLRRMKAYFDRHVVDAKGAGWRVDSKGWQAWLAWGGDSGRKWCNEVLAEIDGARHNPREFSQKGGHMAGKKNPSMTEIERIADSWIADAGAAGDSEAVEIAKIAAGYRRGGKVPSGDSYTKQQAQAALLRMEREAAQSRNPSSGAKQTRFYLFDGMHSTVALGKFATRQAALAKAKAVVARDPELRGMMLASENDLIEAALVQEGIVMPSSKRRNPTWTTAALLAGGAYVYGRSAKVREKVKGVFDRAHAKIENPAKGKKRNPTGSKLTKLDFRPRTRTGYYKRGDDVIYVEAVDAFRNGDRPLGVADWYVSYLGSLTAVDKMGPSPSTQAASGEMRLYEFTRSGYKRVAPEKLSDSWRNWFAYHLKGKKRNPSAAEHAKRGRQRLSTADDLFFSATEGRTGRQKIGTLVDAAGMAAMALQDFDDANDATSKKYAKSIFSEARKEAMGGIERNPGKRLHNFKVLDAKGKAIALTTTLAEANKCCPKGGKVVKL